MAEENTRRRDVATATTGAVLLGGGGAMRHAAVRRAYPGKAPKIHGLAMLRKAPKGKRLFWGGTAVGLVGLPPLAVGTSNLAHGSKVDKADYSAFWAGHRLGRKMPAPRPKIVHLRHDNGKFACGAKHVPMMSTGVVTDRSGRPFTAMKRNDNPTSSSKYAHNVTCPTCKAKAGDPEAARTLERSRLQAVHEGNSERAREKRTGQHRGLQAIQRNINKAAKERTPQERADRLANSARRAHAYGIEQARAGNLPGVRRANRVRNARAGRAAMLFVGKADDKRKGFWREGLSGTREALGQRAESYKEPVPAKLRAAQLGVGAGTGALGSLAARAALGHRGNALKPFLTPVAGGLAATASVPLSNHYVSHRHPGYEITPTGVRRKKTPAVMPSKKSSQHRPLPRSFQQDLSKADDPKIPHPGDGLEMQRHLEEHHGLHWKTARELDARGWTSAAWREYHEGSHLSGRDVMRQPLRHTHPHLRIVKADTKYRGASTPYRTQRATITAATHTPVIGPFAGSAAASRYAPPGQGRKQALRQYALSSGTAIPAGVAAAYGGAALANRSEGAHRAAAKLVDAKAKVEHKARSAVGLGEKKPGRMSRATGRFLETKAGKPFRTPKGAIGGMAGFAAGRAVVGGVGDQAAISLNQRDQRRYNTKHHIEKLDQGQGQSKRQRHDLARQKRRSAALAELSGSAGLGSLVLLAARKRQPAVTLGTIGAGVGGTNSLLGAKVQRTEAQVVDPVKKDAQQPLPRPKNFKELYAHGGWHHGMMLKDWEAEGLTVDHDFAAHQAQHEKEHAKYKFLTHYHLSAVKKGLVPGTREWHLPKQGVVRSAGRWLSVLKDRENPVEGTFFVDPDDMEVFGWTRDRSKAHRSRPGNWTTIARTKDPRSVYQSKRRNNIAKASALTIQGSKQDHAEMLRRYGDRGSLPKNLSREERMKAYEARYVHHGGDKANRWSRRAGAGEGMKNVGLGVGTAGGAAWLATRGKRGAKLLTKHPKLRSHAETTAVAGATLGGAGEMLAGYAHRRQSSYANSPGGVAASALRRMRAYTPSEDQ